MNIVKRILRKIGRYPVSLAVLNALTGGRGRLVQIGGEWPLHVLWLRGLQLDFTQWERVFSATYGRNIKPGDVVFDIGAENGEWAALAGTRAGGQNVHIFEPNNAACGNIRATWEINRLEQPGGIWEGFVGDQSSVPVPPATQRRQWPALRGTKLGFESLQHAGDIPTLTIDDYVAATGIVPTIIKMDIEGAEAVALKGAQKTLSQHKPKVFLSLHPTLVGSFGADAQTILDDFKAMGFSSRQISVDHEEHWVFWNPAGAMPAFA